MQTFQKSHAFDLIIQQFQSYLGHHIEIKKIIDPLSDICLSNVIKQLDMIKTVFETEGLLGMTETFTSYCDKILDFVHAEKFYIFTCVQMINSTNPKDFYRERSLFSLLRIFYFLASLKEVIENQTFGKDLNLDSIRELQQYMLGLFEILLGKLDTYQYINPNIIFVCQKSNTIMEHLIDQELYGEAIVKSLQAKFQTMLEEVTNVMANTVNELRNIITAELKKQGNSRDGSTSTAPNYGNYEYNNRGSSPYNSNQRKNFLTSRQPTQPGNNRKKSGSSNEMRGTNEGNNYYTHRQIGNKNTTPTSGTERTAMIRGGGMASIFGRDVDQMTVAKSVFTQKSKLGNRVAQMMLNKTNVVKEKKLLNEIVKQDENIDLDKIKKYFENVINEKHFLNNYGKARLRNQAGMIATSAEDENFHLQRQSDVQIAKRFFKQGMIQMPQNHFREAQNKTRISNLQRDQYWIKVKSQANRQRESEKSPGGGKDLLAQLRRTNFRGSNFYDLQSSRDNQASAIGNMIFNGVMREKTGIIKEHNHIDIYRGRDTGFPQTQRQQQHNRGQSHDTMSGNNRVFNVNSDDDDEYQQNRNKYDDENISGEDEFGTYNRGRRERQKTNDTAAGSYEVLDTKEFIPIGNQGNVIIGSLSSKIGKGILTKGGILDNPKYKETIYHPQYDQLKKKEQEVEKTENLVQGLFNKIKEQYTDRLANLFVNKSGTEEVKAIMNEYMIEDLDDNRYEADDQEDVNDGDKSKSNKNVSKDMLKGGKNVPQNNRRNLNNRNIKRRDGINSVKIKAQQQQQHMRDLRNNNQPSFGKRDRLNNNNYQFMNSNKFNPFAQFGGDDEEDFHMALLQRELSGRTPEEFSDESLFGEDKIEDLLEKKQSFQRQANGTSSSHIAESFIRDSKGSPLLLTQNLFNRSGLLNNQLKNVNSVIGGGGLTNRTSQQIDDITSNKGLIDLSQQFKNNNRY
eukprot:403372510